MNKTARDVTPQKLYHGMQGTLGIANGVGGVRHLKETSSFENIDSSQTVLPNLRRLNKDIDPQQFQSNHKKSNIPPQI
jgi:hypothetical protein